MIVELPQNLKCPHTTCTNYRLSQGIHIVVSAVYFLYVLAVLLGFTSPSNSFDDIGDVGALVGYTTGERVGIAIGELLMIAMLSWFGYVVYRGYRYLREGGLPF